MPAHAYSGLYCTDIAKSIQVPIIHVNGDEPEAVVFASRMAAEFRQRFGIDFVLDIVCYRRHGHNEADEPAFTQPIMYRAIKDTARRRGTLYADAGWPREGVIAADEAQAMWDTLFRQIRRGAAGGAILSREQGGLAGRQVARPEAPARMHDETEEATAVHRKCRPARGRAWRSATVPGNFDAQSEDHPAAGCQARR